MTGAPNEDGRGTSEAGRRILARIREANRGRPPGAHPGDFGSWPAGGDAASAGGGAGEEPGSAESAGAHAANLDRFASMFDAAGGEVVRVGDVDAASGWLRSFAVDFETMAVGEHVEARFVPDRPRAAPRRADLSISRARCAIAETGSLVLDARDGRRAQLLAPVHVVLLDAGAIHPTMRDAFLALGDDLPSALGLHSGPSKSADIGQVMVKGVHGPGRLVAVVIGGAA